MECFRGPGIAFDVGMMNTFIYDSSTESLHLVEK